MRKWLFGGGIVLVLVFFILHLYAFHRFVITGQTMGTTYTILYYERNFYYYGSFFFNSKFESKFESRLESKFESKFDFLTSEIDHQLRHINDVFSTYRFDSELSRLNRTEPFKTIRLSQPLWDVLQLAKRLYYWSEGMWDPTIKPLVDLWGFSGSNPDKTYEMFDQKSLQENNLAKRMPHYDAILNAKSYVGFDALLFLDNQSVKKDRSIYIDLSSIAKGYGVDLLCELLEQKGIGRYMVEIGGEVRVGKRKPNGQSWQIGIYSPESNLNSNLPIQVLSLEYESLATSGDYRQGFYYKGKRYSHILDPLTGYPVSGNVASVSVRGSSCALVDGLATAMMVMGYPLSKEKWLEWKGIDVYMYSHDKILIWQTK